MNIAELLFPFKKINLNQQTYAAIVLTNHGLNEFFIFSFLFPIMGVQFF